MQSDDDIQFYRLVAQELSINRRDEGLWTKAFALENGDERATKARYIRERVESLKRRKNGSSHQNDLDLPAVTPEVKQQAESSPSKAIGEVSPWARFLARAIDLAVVAVLALTAGIAMAFSLPIWKMGAIPSALLSTAVFGVALLGYEAVAVSLFGTTIGKAIFGLRISADDGGLLELKSAFRRAFWAWASGNACYFFFPAATVFFWWRGYKVLTTTGGTSWDDKAGSTVTQSTIGSFRFLLGASVSVFLMLGSLILSNLNKQALKQELRAQTNYFDPFEVSQPPKTQSVRLIPFTGKLDEDYGAPQPPRTQSAQDVFNPYTDKHPGWGSWMAYRSTDEMTRIARESEPRLNDPRAWSAVVAWQRITIQLWNTSANDAMYQAINTVLDGLNENHGVCRPGKITTIAVADATEGFPAGSQLVMHECDR